MLRRVLENLWGSTLKMSFRDFHTMFDILSTFAWPTDICIMASSPSLTCIDRNTQFAKVLLRDSRHFPPQQLAVFSIPLRQDESLFRTP